MSFVNVDETMISVRFTGTDSQQLIEESGAYFYHGFQPCFTQTKVNTKLQLFTLNNLTIDALYDLSPEDAYVHRLSVADLHVEMYTQKIQNISWDKVYQFIVLFV